MIIPAKEAPEDADPAFGRVVAEPAVPLSDPAAVGVLGAATVGVDVAGLIGRALTGVVGLGTVVADAWLRGVFPASVAAVVASGAFTVAAEVREVEWNAVDTTR